MFIMALSHLGHHSCLVARGLAVHRSLIAPFSTSILTWRQTQEPVIAQLFPGQL